jgi:hypothetical protein
LKGHGTAPALALHDLAEGHARGVVDADVDILPAGAAAVALTGAVAGDAVAYLIELAELFDVDVDHLAGLLALVSAGWLGRFQGAQLAQPQALEGAAHGGRRDADGGGDLLARHALAAQACDALDHLWRYRLAQPLGPRAAILQAGQAFLLEAITPFAAGARANACGFTGRLRRLPMGNHFDQPLSTMRRQAGILMDVHSALPRIS